MDAERGKLNDPENKYKGYDLSKAAFKFSVDFSKFSDGNYPYEIRVTTEDGQKISIKQGYLKVKNKLAVQKIKTLMNGNLVQAIKLAI